jgi:hypothetical protein
MTKQSDTTPGPPPPARRYDLSVAHTADEINHRLHWADLVDSGAIENRNPPMSPENRAILEANDALFRARRTRFLNEW